MVAAFRPAVLADTGALVALEREYYAAEGYAFDGEAARHAIATLIGDPSLGRLWAIDGGGTVVGYLVLTLGYSLEYRGRDAFVDELYVAPSHRGRGLGREAMALAEATCRDLGVRALHLEVERENATARELYRRTGFVDHTRILMTKRLG